MHITVFKSVRTDSEIMDTLRPATLSFVERLSSFWMY